LQEFDIPDNNLDDKSVELIAKGLMELRLLTTLRFASKNKFRTGGHAIATLITPNPIQIMDLPHNTIVQEGIDRIVPILK
jgi:hypothetical protein